jgi:hypothetical protein
VFLVRYELNLYILFRRNLVFKWLKANNREEYTSFVKEAKVLRGPQRQEVSK